MSLSSLERVKRVGESDVEETGKDDHVRRRFLHHEKTDRQRQSVPPRPHVPFRTRFDRLRFKTDDGLLPRRNLIPYDVTSGRAGSRTDGRMIGGVNPPDAATLSDDLFDDSFTTCMNVSYKTLDENFKVFVDLTVAEGCIRLTPGVRNRIESSVQ